MSLPGDALPVPSYRYRYVALSHHPSQRCHYSGEPAKDLISLLMLWATLNDSATEDVSSSPSPHVAVIIAR